MAKSKSRALEWSKEVERRARDSYRRAFPGVERAKFAGREDYAGHPDLVGLPIHVQVKARAKSAISTLWKDAEHVRLAKGTGSTTHLVTQADRAPVLVTMKLDDYVAERSELEAWRKLGTENLGLTPPKSPSPKDG